MFVKSEHYNARKEDTLNDEGQVISTYHKLRILAGRKVTKEDRQPEVAASALAVSAFAAAAIAAASGVGFHTCFIFMIFPVHHSTASHCGSAGQSNLDFFKPRHQDFSACRAP